MIINFWEGLGYSFFSIFMYELFMMAIREIKKRSSTKSGSTK